MPEIQISLTWLTALFGIGLFIGYISGFLGLGGSIFIIPVFHFTLLHAGFPEDLSLKYAMGSGISVSCLTAVSGFLIHGKNIRGPRHIKTVLLCCVPAGAFLGASFASKVSGSLLHYAFGTALVLAALSFSLNKEVKKKELDFPLPFYIVVGLVLPVFSTFVGLGGAIFTTLLLAGILRYSIKNVIPVSNFIQVLGSLFGTISFIYNGLNQADPSGMTLGYVYLPIVIAMSFGSVPLALFGAKRTKKTSPVWIRRVFSIVLFTVAVKYIFF